MLEPRKGHILRIVESLGMGYIAEPENDCIWPFQFTQIQGYGGQNPENFGLVPKFAVDFYLREGELVEVKPQKSFTHSGGN